MSETLRGVGLTLNLFAALALCLALYGLITLETSWPFFLAATGLGLSGLACLAFAQVCADVSAIRAAVERREGDPAEHGDHA